MRLRPTFVQGLVLGLGGLAFAFFGCLGALGGMTSSSSTSGSGAITILGSVAFVIGAVAALTGGVLFVIATFKAIFGKRDGVS